MTDPRHDLDDPEYAAFAWGRYKRIMAWMALLSLVSAVAVVGLLWWWIGKMPPLMGIFVGFGVAGTILLAAALMGLVFLSSGSGHDERVEDPLRGEVDIGD